MKTFFFNVKMVISLIIFIFVAFQSCEQQPSDTGAGSKSDSPFPIYYALNESHSNSWVRQSLSGLVGIVYGVYPEGTVKKDGSSPADLMYRTIMPDGKENEEKVTTDRGADKSVLLFDSDSNPHIFFARSDNSDQVIVHWFKNEGSAWLQETVIHFNNQGGKFIYELSAEIDRNDVFHLLALITWCNPDSADFLEAYQDSHLYHITNRSGNWEETLIHKYDTFYTYDMCVKTQRRQDIAVDKDGYAHVVFGEQYRNDPKNHDDTKAVLHYATNKTSVWVKEMALMASNDTDDAGWYPSLSLNQKGQPAIASTYLARVQTRSVKYARLCFSVRKGKGNWETTVVAEMDDGYFGSDGRKYTGALTHLKFDSNNIPHIVFSDIASSHNPQNVLCTGQIRYAVLEGFSWDISTIYRQPSPQGFYQCREMGGQRLVISSDGQKVQVIGQELFSDDENVYRYQLVRFIIK